MTIEWSRQEVLEAVRTRLLRAGAVLDGYSAVDVVAESGGMLVIFHWRRDPNTYAIKVEFPRGSASPWTGGSYTGLPVTAPDEWAADFASRFAIELDNGLVRRSRRMIRDGYVLLDTHDAPDAWPAGFYIGRVALNDLKLSASPDDLEKAYSILGSLPASVSPPVSEVGAWLAQAGMDVTIPRQLIVEARLACWLQAYVDNAHGEPYVGQAAASWEDKRRTIARLDLVHIQPGVPSEVRDALVRLVVCEVAEAGALRVVTAVDDPELHGLGFRPANGGGLALHTRSTEPPSDPAAGT
ncbi:hypothetical protein [Nonomuraea sp. NEAU-A123]|uniref:hypothetical protein n=1 Tax=Nonomuraea sp. NEAU-A123 TaxID=2839649 RepID=UPI001BE47374|nr:hypothetical protein [Nonomuraea sp. NEAU-A123]MBT2226332.1 hypothetical protein [Nonomuraea sp. NEAU-A123]